MDDQNDLPIVPHRCDVCDPPTKAKRRRDIRVQRVRRELLAAAPHLDDRKFEELVAAFSRLSVLTRDTWAFLRTKGLIGDSGEVRASAMSLDKFTNTMMRLAVLLGLSPGTAGHFAKPVQFMDLKSIRGDDNEEVLP